MSVVDSIVTSAKQNGIDPLLAIADAIQESGLNPNAVGDAGTSFGLFQLHRGGELGNLTPSQAFDPTTNANTALSVFHSTLQSNPSLQGGSLAAASERPANQTAYAGAVQNIYSALKSIQSQNSNYGYDDIVTHYSQNLSQYAQPSAGTNPVSKVNTAQNANWLTDSIFGSFLNSIGLDSIFKAGTGFSDGFKTFLTNLFLPETYVRIVSFWIGAFLIVGGIVFIVMDYLHTKGDS